MDEKRIAPVKDNLRETLEHWGGEICDEDIKNFASYDLLDFIHESKDFKLCRKSGG